MNVNFVKYLLATWEKVMFSLVLSIYLQGQEGHVVSLRGLKSWGGGQVRWVHGLREVLRQGIQLAHSLLALTHEPWTVDLYPPPPKTANC